jgi:hypothetical protein
MAEANNTNEDKNKSITVPRQDQDVPSPAEVAQEQANVTKGHDAEVKARELSGEELRQKALKAEADKGMKHGLLKEQYDKMSLGEQKRAELNDPYSDLRNRITPQDEVDFQILSNTNGYTIEAMTGVPLAQLFERAKELGTTIKGNSAANGGPGGNQMVS